MTHSSTVLWPVFSLIPALFFLFSVRMKPGLLRLKISMYLFILTTLLSTLTCALGGSGMRRVEKIPNLNPHGLSLHAWFGGMAFLISILMMVFAIKSLRAASIKKTYPIIMVSSALFLLMFLLSVFQSGSIFSS